MRERRPSPSLRSPIDFADDDVSGLFDSDVARRTVRVSSLVAAAASISFLPIYVVFGPSSFIAPNALAGIALIIIALAPFRAWNVQMYAAVTVGLALLTAQLLLLGRVDSASAVWFLVPPLAAMFVGDRRMASYCALAAIAVIALVVVARELGWPIVGNVVQPRADLVMAFSLVGSLVTTGAVADITLRARRTLMADVEARTLDLAGALQEARAARAEAVAAAEAKDRFFANLTHEIRTPLSGIAGSAELLASADLDPDHRELAKALLASSRNLVALVNAMLSHARLRAGNAAVEVGPVAPRLLAAEVDDLLEAPATGKGLALRILMEPDLPAWIATDGIKVRQVVTNLVGNAVKFTEHGSVTVRFAADGVGAAPGELRLVITVSDTGPGIPPHLQDAVFEPFVQAEASISRAHGGTGLGLAIARQLAEVLGGTLTLHSRVGEGSAFTFAVPVTAAAAPAAPPAAPAEPATSGEVPAGEAAAVRVLLVEDNGLNRAVATRMLERLGASVAQAEDGARAIELAADGAFEIVLMDLQMPRMDGLAAARAIRRHETETGRPRVPIVAMTGNAHEDYADDCVRAGMDDYLVKPVDFARLADLLERSRAGRWMAVDHTPGGG